VPPDQSSHSYPPLISFDKARAAGRAHGERAFTAMISPEMFREYLKGAVTRWRSAGFSEADLREAEMAAQAAYRGK